MLLSHFKRLCTLLPTLISASTHTNTSSAPASLPDSFQRAVPACAQPCLQIALLNQFPLACTAPTSLNCLCSRYSISGASLGEVALACIYASCPNVESSQTASTYNICLGQEDAVPQTQSTLMVTVSPTTVSQSTTFATSLVTTKPTSALVSSPTPSVGIDSVSSTTSFTSTTPTASATVTPAAAPSPTPTMKPAQIAGIAVAAAAAFIIAIGLMALSVFLRKRRERKGMERLDEEKPRPFPQVAYTQAYPQDSWAAPSARIPPRQFPLYSVPGRHELPSYSNQKPEETAFGTRALTLPSTVRPSRKNTFDPNLGQGLQRPAALKTKNSSELSVPLSQIGVAISAVGSGSLASTAVGRRPSCNAGAKQQRPKSLRFTLDDPQRPDSVLSQGTVFEEDAPASRRRSSRLLPTPPIPIPPNRTFQPSRPPPVFNPPSPTRTVLDRPQGSQQSGLSLDIPPRHSRSLAEIPSQNPAAYLVPSGGLAPPPQFSRSTSITSSELSNGEDIPDYYFTAHGSSPKPPVPAPTPSLQRKEPQKFINIRLKKSSSTVSRTASRASTNIRDSVSSQTSFESVDSNDPTPEEDDNGKQLSPVAESPISTLRYPKVPRASNQLVPRSPKIGLSEGSPRRIMEPSALLVKRRGEREALMLEDQLCMDSPRRTEVRNHIKNYQHHTRSSSLEAADIGSSRRPTDRQTRVQSGQWPQSPVMYDMDAVRPLNLRSRQQEAPEMEALKSPVWIPNLTPKRHGDDLFLHVTYSKPVH